MKYCALIFMGKVSHEISVCFTISFGKDLLFISPVLSYRMKVFDTLRFFLTLTGIGLGKHSNLKNV